MAHRAFLHVGTPKTGTTYLQSVLWANRDVLRDQGVLLPLSRVRDHYYLSSIARDAERQLQAMPPHAHTAWDRMLAEVAGWEGDALISHELFAVCSAERARWTTEQLATVADEVHVIVTARDLARQVPAEWQQTIKHGRSHLLSEFYAELRSDSPSVLFWQVQDLPRLLDDWSAGVRCDRVHVVTVPPAGASSDLLWRRFASVVGVDPESVDLSVDMPNESLGVVEVETLRRVNLHAPPAEQPRQQLLIRQVLAEGILAGRAGATKFAPPAHEHAWVVECGTEMVRRLRSAPYDVVGDLDELVPPAEPRPGPNPDDVTDSAVAEVAAETISAVLYRTYELETARCTDQIAGLQQRVRRLEQRARTLEEQLVAARQALRSEREQPLKVHLRRRAGLVKRRILRQPRA